MRELREDTFSGNKNEDAHDHVDRVLNIVSLFNYPGVSQDAILLRVFPFTLTDPLKDGWIDSLQELSTLRTSLKKLLSKGIVHHPRPLNDLKTSKTSSRNQLVYEPNPGNNYDFPCFDQPLHYHIDQSPPQNLDSHSHFMLLARENNRIFKELLRTLKTNSPVGEPEGSNDFTECSIPIDPPLPCNDFLGDTIVDIDLLLGEHLDTLSTGDREIDFNPIRDIEELERLLTDDPVPVPVPSVFDEPLGNSDSVPRSYDVTFSNSLFDFNDDYNLCYDNLLCDEEFEDISSLDPLESTPFIDESSLLVTPLPNPKQICLREVERFDPFFSLTQSGGKTRVMETPSFGFHHMPSPYHAEYSPKEVMYCYYHPHLTSGDRFDQGPKMK
ncbi:hypothetical protein Tco_0690609 [Tanacetum coccineum]